MSDVPPQVPSSGDLIAGKYRLLSVLGRGGMGVVFDGQHELLDRRVAIKVLAPEVLGSKEAVTRFMNEARAAAKITSDRVVQVLDVGVLDGGLPFMVMERLEGMDLAQLAAQQGHLAIGDVIDLLLEALEGVAHAHIEGIIHRDLKPSNLFLARRPDRTSAVKVLDFGISKITSSGGTSSGSVTATSAVIGSPLYMSPEQLRSAKSIDARADIWSLGVIAYELLTQTLPFTGDNLVAIFAAIQEREARPLNEIRPDIPRGLDEVVRRCLKRDPGERFPNVVLLARALTSFGASRARLAMDRLEVHVASRGASFAEAVASLPITAPPPDLRALGAASEGAPRASRPAPAVTPPTLESGPQSTLLEPKRWNVAAPVKGPEASSAPWSSTHPRAARARPRQIALLAGVAALLLAGVGGALALRTRAAHVDALANPNPSVEPAVATHEATEPAPLQTSTPADAAAATVSAAAPSPPSSASAAPPSETVARDAVPTAKPSRPPAVAPTHPARPPVEVAHPAPVAPPKPSATPANPLTMKPL